MISKPIELKKTYKTPEEEMKALREISIAEYLMDNPHRNIINFKGINNQTTRLYEIQMEKGAIIKAKDVCSLPLLQKIYFILDCCEALTYISEHGIEHRDIKTQNWVFLGEGKNRVCKLIDFGLAKMHKLPGLLQERLKIGKSSRQSIILLNDMVSNSKSVVQSQCDIKVTLNSLGNLKLTPPEYEPSCLGKISSHVLLTGKTDAWYFGIQLVRTFFDLSSASQQSLRKLMEEQRDETLEALQLNNEVQKKGLRLRIIFHQDLSRQQLFQEKGLGEFAVQFLKLVEGLFVFNMTERMSPKVFALNFIELIKQYKVLDEQDLKEMQMKYAGCYQSELQRLVMIKIWLRQQLKKSNEKSIKIIQHVIKQQENYIARKYRQKKTNFQHIDLILDEIAKRSKL